MKFVENLLENNRIKICVEDKPELFGIIEKYLSKQRTKTVYKVKLYWKDKYQGTKYGNDINEAKNICKHLNLSVILFISKNSRIMIIIITIFFHF
jgi:hypothetical protein